MLLHGALMDTCKKYKKIRTYMKWQANKSVLSASAGMYVYDMYIWYIKQQLNIMSATLLMLQGHGKVCHIGINTQTLYLGRNHICVWAWTLEHLAACGLQVSNQSTDIFVSCSFRIYLECITRQCLCDVPNTPVFCWLHCLLWKLYVQPVILTDTLETHFFPRKAHT